MLAALARVRDRLFRLGIRPGDRPDERLKKQALVLTSVTISVAALVWSAMYLWLGRPLAAAVPLTYTVVSVLGLAHFARSGNDVWGDAVNVASRMETFGQPGRIHVSGAIEAALRGRYRFEERGTMEIKGLGEMNTFFLLGPVE
jgi:hypothetical protein